MGRRHRRAIGEPAEWSSPSADAQDGRAPWIPNQFWPGNRTILQVLEIVLTSQITRIEREAATQPFWVESRGRSDQRARLRENGRRTEPPVPVVQQPG